jgi:hypothetical protein
MYRSVMASTQARLKELKCLGVSVKVLLAPGSISLALHIYPPPWCGSTNMPGDHWLLQEELRIDLVLEQFVYRDHGFPLSMGEGRAISPGEEAERARPPRLWV